MLERINTVILTYERKAPDTAQDEVLSAPLGQIVIAICKTENDAVRKTEYYISEIIKPLCTIVSGTDWKKVATNPFAHEYVTTDTLVLTVTDERGAEHIFTMIGYPAPTHEIAGLFGFRTERMMAAFLADYVNSGSKSYQVGKDVGRHLQEDAHPLLQALVIYWAFGLLEALSRVPSPDGRNEAAVEFARAIAQTAFITGDDRSLPGEPSPPEYVRVQYRHGYSVPNTPEGIEIARKMLSADMGMGGAAGDIEDVEILPSSVEDVPSWVWEQLED